MKKIILSASMLSMLFFANSCKKESDASKSVNAYTTTVKLAYNSSQTDPQCFLDLDSGKVYRVSEALAHQNEIDMVYVLRYSNANDPMFISLGSFDGSSGYPISYWDKTTLGINRFSNFNHILLTSGSSSNTATGFAAVKTVADLNTWLNGNDPIHDFTNASPNEIGDMVIFKTHQNKNGAFKITNAVNGSSGFATIEIKIEP